MHGFLHFLRKRNEGLTPILAHLPCHLLIFNLSAPKKYPFFQGFIFTSKSWIHFVPGIIMDISKNWTVVIRWLWEVVLDWNFESEILVEPLRDVIVVFRRPWLLNILRSATAKRTQEILSAGLDFVSGILAFVYGHLLLDLGAFLTDENVHVKWVIVDWGK